MHQTGTNMIARKVLWYEASAIFFIMAIIWIDEILDIPYVLLDGPPTPINWRESLFESLIIVIIGMVILQHTYHLLTRLSHLESILPVCPSCKKIRVDQEFWQDIEKYVHERVKADSLYGICPDCLKKYYPEMDRTKK